jgi:hypothetical protein
MSQPTCKGKSKYTFCAQYKGVSETAGRAMAQAVSRRSLTAKARVRSRVSPFGICGGQGGTGTGVSPSTWVSNTAVFRILCMNYSDFGCRNNCADILPTSVAKMVALTFCRASSLGLRYVCTITWSLSPWKSDKCYLFWVCVCSLSYPACKAHALYCIAICGLSGCTVFFHVIS